MAVAPIGILPFVLFFGGFSLPLGLPPLPEDPVISRAAPAECLAYVSWAGTATPDAKSANQTEQLLAEPEVQTLLAAIDSAVVAGIKKNDRPSGVNIQRSTFAEIVPDVYPLAKTLLTRPAAVFLSKVEIAPQGPNVQAGAIVGLEEKAAVVRASLERLEKLLPPEIMEKVEISGTSFHRIKPSPIMTVTWGVRGKYLIVGVGEGSVEGILSRIKEEPPAWLAEIRKQLHVDRQSTLMYFNVKQAVAQFSPLGGPKLKAILDVFGLDNVSYLASVTGLDSKGVSTRTLVAIDGQPQGVFHLAAAKPLTAADLSPIPRDATIAAAGRLDAHAALELLLSQLEKMDSNDRKNLERDIAEMEKEPGIDLRQDLLKPLGDVWCVYNSPGEGGILVTGLTGVVQVKDHDVLELALGTLMARFDEHWKRLNSEFDKRMEGISSQFDSAPNGFRHESRLRLPRIVKTAFAGHVIYHFEIPDGDLPMAPAWCLTEKELIVSTFPQNIKSYLSRGKDFQSLAAVPEVSEALEGGAVAVSYCDTRKMAEFAYPLLCFGGKGISSELNREGLQLDSSLLPSAAAIFPHLQPSLGIVRRTSAGIEIASRGPLAGMGAGPLLPAALFGLFAIRSEPVAKRMGTARAVPMNALKQIALAMMNYESANRTLPPAYVSDKKTGKPLLSWRVAILPYIEEAALYQQFHLDEPWDSPHNKPLIARMPATYRGMGPAGALGKTRFLTLRHKDSAFPGKDGVKFADITRGTSNTIMAVEADEAHAVIWTKPDDLEFDPEKPLAGLTGQPPRGFNLVFCDGSVRFFSDTIDSEIFGDMVIRHSEKKAKAAGTKR